MDYQYDDFIDKLVKHVINSNDKTDTTFVNRYYELVYVLGLYAKEFADSNLADFAQILNNQYACNLPASQIVSYLKKHYQIYLENRM